MDLHRMRCSSPAKRKLFEDFARGSDIADAAPDAVDLSEAQLAHEVVASERKRLLGF